MKAFACALVFATACHQTGGGSSAGSATTSASSAPALASASAPALASASAPAPVPAAAGGAATATLASGATLTLPEGARASEMKDPGKRLPGVVKKAHKFELASSGKRLLLVNEMDMEGMTCQALLDRDLERAEKAKADDDPDKRALREMKGVVSLEIGGHRALYAESMNKSAQSDETKMGVATLITCRDADYLVIMVAGDQPTATDETKKMLVAIAESYRK